MTDIPRYWHAVYTTSRSEKRVKERFEIQGIEHFLPIQTIIRQWKYRKQKVRIPVIAGMIFVKVSRAEQLQVLRTPGVVTFLRLRGSSTAAIIPDKQIEDFRFLVEYSDHEIEITNENIEIGDRVIVTGGSLQGLTGELIQRKGEFKVIVRVEAFGCAMVTIPGALVEPVKNISV